MEHYESSPAEQKNTSRLNLVDEGTIIYTFKETGPDLIALVITVTS